MAIFKCGEGFEIGTTKNKSSKWPEQDSDPRMLDCQSDTLTTQPHCLVFATLQSKMVSNECFSVKHEAELCSFTYNSHLENSN